MQPLALAVVGGLMVSMFLTLLVIPAVYLTVHRVADRFKIMVTGMTPVAVSPGSAAASSERSVVVRSPDIGP